MQKRKTDLRARRAAKVIPREQYLAEHSLSRDKPWEAEGMSRAAWYRNSKGDAWTGETTEPMEAHAEVRRHGHAARRLARRLLEVRRRDGVLVVGKLPMGFTRTDRLLG